MMLPTLFEGLLLITVAWLITFTLHSTAFLGTAWMLSQAPRLQGDRTQDALWKTAILGGLLTTSLHVFGGSGPGLATWELPGAEVPAPQVSVLADAPPAPPVALDMTALPEVVDVAPLPPLEPVDQAVPALSAPSLAIPEVPSTPWYSGLVDGLRGVWQPLLIAFWLSIGLLLLGWRAMQRRRFMRSLGLRRDVTEEQVLALWQRVVATSGASERLQRRARLTTARDLASPVAFGAGEVCIPERVLTELTPAQQHSVLAHEWAHHLRRDPQWLRGLRWLESLFFFQPLLRVARIHQSEAAEGLCDAWAAQHTGSRKALAQSLVTVATWVHEPMPAWTTSMAASRSPLTTRVKRLLADPADAIRDLPVGLRTGLVVGLILAIAVAVPGIALKQPMGERVGTDQEAPVTLATFTINEADADQYRTFRVSWEQGGATTTVHAKGVQFTEGYDSISSVRPDGYLEVRETHEGRERTIYISDPGGVRNETYLINGNRQLFGETARDWLTDVLQELDRNLSSLLPPPPPPALQGAEDLPPPPPPGWKPGDPLGALPPQPGQAFTLTFANIGARTSVRGEGVLFNNEAPQISLRDADSYLRVLDEFEGEARYLRVVMGDDGNADYIYQKDWRDADLDYEAQHWLAGIIDQVVRATAVQTKHPKLSQAQQTVLAARDDVHWLALGNTAAFLAMQPNGTSIQGAKQAALDRDEQARRELQSVWEALLPNLLAVRQERHGGELTRRDSTWAWATVGLAQASAQAYILQAQQEALLAESEVPGSRADRRAALVKVQYDELSELLHPYHAAQHPLGARGNADSVDLDLADGAARRLEKALFSTPWVGLPRASDLIAMQRAQRAASTAASQEQPELRLTFFEGETRIRVQGAEVTLHDDKPHVELTTTSGYLDVTESTDRGQRQVRISRPDGQIMYDYRINNAARPFDDAAEQWLDGILERAVSLFASQADLQDAQARLTDPDRSMVIQRRQELTAKVAQQQAYTDSLMALHQTLQARVDAVNSAQTDADRAATAAYAEAAAQARAQANQMRDILMRHQRHLAQLQQAQESQQKMRATFKSNGHTSYVWTNGERAVRAQFRGELQFDADDRVTALGEGGMLRLEERQGAQHQWVAYSPAPDGSISMQYGAYDGATADANLAQRLLAEAIPRVPQFAEYRTPVLYAQGGTAAVLREIDRLAYDETQMAYYTSLMQQPRVRGLERVIPHMVKQVSSDFLKVRFLKLLSPEEAQAVGGAAAYMQAVATIAEDSPRADLLMDMATRKGFRPEASAVVEAITAMESEYEKGRVLNVYLPLMATGGIPSSKTHIVDAVASLGSDYERASLALRLVETAPEMNEALALTVLDIVQTLRSDYEKAVFLRELWDAEPPMTASVKAAFGEIMTALDLPTELKIPMND
ncbi:MAG: M56 family metallopeptidase [Bacteroidota bacterium]